MFRHKLIVLLVVFASLITVFSSIGIADGYCTLPPGSVLDFNADGCTCNCKPVYGDRCRMPDGEWCYWDDYLEGKCPQCYDTCHYGEKCTCPAGGSATCVYVGATTTSSTTTSTTTSSTTSTTLPACGNCNLAVYSISTDGHVEKGYEIITVTVQNLGSLAVTSGYINLHASCGSILYDPPIGYLSPGSSKTFTFTWNTQACSCGQAVLRASVSQVRCGSSPCTGHQQTLTKYINIICKPACQNPYGQEGDGRCDYSLRQYLICSAGSWICQGQSSYCSNCNHCGDGMCNCDETYINCPADCKPNCDEGWLTEYRCYGNYRQRKYQHEDCSIEWKTVETCQYGCENNECKEPNICSDPNHPEYCYQCDHVGDGICNCGETYQTAPMDCRPECDDGWLSDYRCHDDWVQRKYQYSDCSIDWVNLEYCEYGCENNHCQDKKDEDCDDRDGYYGSKFCKHGDVYREYRNYYWDGDECDYESWDEKIDDCEYGCEDGHCIDECDCCCQKTCSCRCDCSYCNCHECYDNGDCDKKDGYIGEKFCKNGNVYRTYRNYYWSDCNCLFTETDVLIEDCPAGCEAGYCVDNCNDKDYYTTCDWTCIDDDTKMCTRSFYDYYYTSQGGCKRSEKDASYTVDCNEGQYCYGGSCVSCNNKCDGLCESSACYGIDPDCDKNGMLKACSCEDICSDWIECGDGQKKKTCVEYYYFRGSCKEGDSYVLYATDEQGERETIELGEFNVFNGLITGKGFKRFVLQTADGKAVLRLNITKTNSMAPLTIIVNDEVVNDKILKEGVYEFDAVLDQTTAIEFKPASSSWKLWAPNFYELTAELITL